MSPRAACRLDTLGFGQVFDYVEGKREWLGYGLPIEGAEAGAVTAGDLARGDVATAALGDLAGAVRERVESSLYPVAVVVSDAGVVLGRAGRERLEAPPETAVEDVMQPGPATMRPYVDVEEALGRLDNNHLDHGLVTTPDGKLLGVILRADVEQRLGAGG